MTDRQDTKGRTHQARLSRGRILLLVRFGFLGFAFVFLTGIRGCDDGRPATISCDDRVLRMEPGTCVTLSNPCNDSGRWASPPAYDGFQYEPSEETEALFGANPPFFVQTTRNGSETTRSLCVNEDSPFFTSLDVNFIYGLGQSWGTASIFLTVAPPTFTVQVTARPTHIALGGSSQLVAAVSGGTRPYFYQWIPTETLNDDDIAAPTASPIVTTEYRVRVTDAIGEEAIVGVTVSVDTDIAVTAHPEEMNVGDVAVLVADAAGGTPPYDYIWIPAATLDDPYVPNPSAMPTTTTTYRVFVFDSLGAIMSGSATVKVRLEMDATAEPQNILTGEPSGLFADVRGGSPPYTFTWTPADTLDDPERQNPIAAPTTTTTYHVVARDSAGDGTAGAVTVQVVDDVPPPTANFVFGIDCCPSLTLNASASTGAIVTYTWDLGWTSANPDQITTSPTTSFVIREFDRGPITLTVTAADGQTATATRIF